VNILLAIMQPRMGSPLSAADSTPLSERPGFPMLNYSGAPRSRPRALAYGAIVGGFVALAR
jgi:hypothetical protein